MQFLNDLERKYQVDQWKINGIEFWPIIRIQFAFNILSQSRNIPDKLQQMEPNSKKSNLGFIYKAINFFWRNILDIASLVTLYTKIKGYDYVFAGGIQHRQLVDKKYYNKSYDAIIEDIQQNKQRALIIENSDSLVYIGKVLNFQENIIIQQNYFRTFNKVYHYVIKGLIKSTKYFPDYERFLGEISKSSILTESIKQQYLQGCNVFFGNRFFAIYLFYYFCFKVIKPKAVFGLCFYDTSMLAMFAAASKLKIPSIEIQHGPQSSLHPAYGEWKKVPKQGYAMLPDYYWTWDDKSKMDIRNGVGKIDRTKVLNFGNPWHQFWLRRNSYTKKYKFDSNIILFSMQPLEVYLDDFLIETIKKTYNEYDWWIRIHPRQLDIKQKIIDFFKKNGIEHLVNYNEATDYPLPLILNHIGIHITKTSGTTLEALAFGRKTIVIHDLGGAYYNELLRTGRVILLKEKTCENLVSLICKQFNSFHEVKNNIPIDYLNKLNQFN